jgi:hypothetical protein
MSLKQLPERHETRMMLYLCGIVLPTVCTLMGFYLGTFVVSQHVIDIQEPDIFKGFVGGIIGFIVSMLVLAGMVTFFPKVIDRDDANRAERQSHPHFQKGAHE